MMLLIVRHKSDGTGLATMSLKNRKVSQQEYGRSKSDKSLKTLSGRAPYGVLAL